MHVHYGNTIFTKPEVHELMGCDQKKASVRFDVGHREQCGWVKGYYQKASEIFGANPQSTTKDNMIGATNKLFIGTLWFIPHLKWYDLQLLT